MNKHLVRLAAFTLIPCLVADPTLASASRDIFTRQAVVEPALNLRPTYDRSSKVEENRILSVRGAASAEVMVYILLAAGMIGLAVLYFHVNRNLTLPHLLPRSNPLRGPILPKTFLAAVVLGPLHRGMAIEPPNWPDTAAVGQRIDTQMKKEGLTNDQLSAMLSTVPNVIRNARKGIELPPLLMIRSLSGVLKITVHELLTGQKNRQAALDGLTAEQQAHLKRYEGGVEKDPVVPVEPVGTRSAAPAVSKTPGRNDLPTPFLTLLEQVEDIIRNRIQAGRGDGVLPMPVVLHVGSIIEDLRRRNIHFRDDQVAQILRIWAFHQVVLQDGTLEKLPKSLSGGILAYRWMALGRLPGIAGMKPSTIAAIPELAAAMKELEAAHKELERVQAEFDRISTNGHRQEAAAYLSAVVAALARLRRAKEVVGQHLSTTVVDIEQPDLEPPLQWLLSALEDGAFPKMFNEFVQQNVYTQNETKWIDDHRGGVFDLKRYRQVAFEAGGEGLHDTQLMHLHGDMMHAAWRLLAAIDEKLSRLSVRDRILFMEKHRDDLAQEASDAMKIPHRARNSAITGIAGMKAAA